METEEQKMGRHPATTATLDQAAKWARVFGAWNTVVLVIVIASAIAGAAPSAFMWVRAGILVAAAPVLVRLARKASRAGGTALERLRATAGILPVAVIAVDAIPGVAPLWYAVLQGIGALLLVPVAVIAWRAARESPDAR
jgi:hypothetical protein